MIIVKRLFSIKKQKQKTPVQWLQSFVLFSSTLHKRITAFKANKTLCNAYLRQGISRVRIPCG